MEIQVVEYLNVRGKHYATVLSSPNPGSLWFVLDVAGVDIQDYGFVEFRGNFGWLHLGKGEAWSNNLNKLTDY